MSRQLVQVWRTTGPGKSIIACPKQLLSALRLGKMGIVGVSSIVGWIRVARWVYCPKYLQRKRGVGETRLPLLPGPEITATHSEVMIGKRWRLVPDTITGLIVVLGGLGSRRRNLQMDKMASFVIIFSRGVGCDIVG